MCISWSSIEVQFKCEKLVMQRKKSTAGHKTILSFHRIWNKDNLSKLQDAAHYPPSLPPSSFIYSTVTFVMNLVIRHSPSAISLRYATVSSSSSTRSPKSVILDAVSLACHLRFGREWLEMHRPSPRPTLRLLLLVPDIQVDGGLMHSN